MSFTESVMLELLKAALAGSFAAGVFIMGQAVQRFVFDPATEMHKLIGQIGYDLVFYGNCFSVAAAGNPPGKWEKATNTYREHAAALRSMPLAIPWYDYVAKVLSLPSRQHTYEASAALIWISNMPSNPTLDDFTFKNDKFKTICRVLKVTL